MISVIACAGPGPGWIAAAAAHATLKRLRDQIPDVCPPGWVRVVIEGDRRRWQTSVMTWARVGEFLQALGASTEAFRRDAEHITSGAPVLYFGYEGAVLTCVEDTAGATAPMEAARCVC